MEPEYQVNDVVQISPHVPVFGGCMMIVTEVHVWGLQGFVMVPMPGGASAAFYRAEQGYYARIGKVRWNPNVEVPIG